MCPDGGEGGGKVDGKVGGKGIGKDGAPLSTHQRDYLLEPTPKRVYLLPTAFSYH